MGLGNNPAPASSVSVLGRCRSAGITTLEMVKGKVDHIDGPSAVARSKFLNHLSKIPQVVSTCPRQAGSPGNLVSDVLGCVKASGRRRRA